MEAVNRNGAARLDGVGKAADWLREERRNVLGHWSAFCLDCGAARRWFDDSEAECPDVPLRRHDAAPLPGLQAPFSSTFAVDCEECGAQLREPELLGMRIRKPGK